MTVGLQPQLKLHAHVPQPSEQAGVMSGGGVTGRAGLDWYIVGVYS